MTGTVKLAVTRRDRLYALISAITFVIAMTQPAYYQTRSGETVIGSAMCLKIGAMGLLAGYFEWIANPLLLFSWIAAICGRRYQAAISSTIALIFIASFLFRSKMTYPLYQRESTVPIVGHGLGYWLWMLSAAIMVVGFYRAFIEQRRSLTKPETT
jgi:hypothetical protein